MAAKLLFSQHKQILQSISNFKMATFIYWPMYVADEVAEKYRHSVVFLDIPNLCYVVLLSVSATVSGHIVSILLYTLFARKLVI